MKKLFLVGFFLVLVSCVKENKSQTTRLEGFVFGTTYHITYLSEDNTNYQKSIDSLFYLVNKSLSTYIPTSDISKINAGDSTVIIDQLFAEVFQKSKRLHKDTDGFFDPTVGSLVNAWGFGPKGPIASMTDKKIDSLMQYVGLNKVSIKNSKVLKEHAEIYLDFNSIAKGFGIDVVGRFLESKNIDNYLVEIGGEIRARGKNDKNKYWKVAIEKPNTDGTQSLQTAVEIVNSSMATSGNYRKFRVTKEGKKFVHTINPKTGFAKESNLLSATVIAPTDCADVDALATAFMAMGLEKTKSFLEKYKKYKVVLIYAGEKGTLEEFRN
jgi:thiamine biosynthesis lipoprotein